MRPRLGCFEVRWDPKDREGTKRAGRVFKKMKRRGYAAYRLKREGEELVREFEPRLGPR